MKFTQEELEAINSAVYSQIEYFEKLLNTPRCDVNLGREETLEEVKTLKRILEKTGG